MKSAGSGRLVFFEPWSLGDVVIAAAALRELNRPAAIACHSSWHPLLRCALAERPDLELIAVDLPYTTRNRANPFDASGGTAANPNNDIVEVLSIRGDFRDLAAARRLFPAAKIRMNGWVRFFGRKSAIVNFPSALGLLAVENRYHSWAKLVGITYAQIETTYRHLQSQAPRNRQIVIHVGAQWRSKQFPDVVGLRNALSDCGYTVMVLAGPGDLLPRGMDERELTRVADAALIEDLHSAEQVITNDSGPMHVAAFLGCRTTALVRTSPIDEWAPPATQIIRSPETPRGYRPNRRYMSDDILPGWPSMPELLAKLQEFNWST